MRATTDETQRLDPIAAISAFGRATYSDLVTVVVLSVAASVASVPLVTLGAALLALVETMTDVVEGETTGQMVSERGRFAAFRKSFRRNLRRGLPLSLLAIGVVVTTYVYSTIALTIREPVFLLGALAGLYAVVVVVVVLFRAASLVARAPEPAGGDSDASSGLSATAALRDASYHLLETPSFSVLQCCFAALLLGLCVALGIAVVMLLPGWLALLEVVAFEETTGEGAERIVLAYRGELV
ncbi:hypothetical protein AUR64_14770 [Haloprofundus marisrubri]|uniref:DUF624 domain-containing protein n=1 Tax=Haloprofundus marisrubri TaxID=1514971 RepID=A0A0W1R6E8_9EURY|nr:hypothetical protein [Haloprofundus marisrubri]KTG09062.1 hypothetical protein AUR64_14770 [Haloprofundus marisrubri]